MRWMLVCVALGAMAIGCDRRCPWGAEVQGAAPPNGQVQWCQKEVDGSFRKDGKMMSWYASGQKKAEATYALGKLEKHFRVWYADGTPQADLEFKDGVPDGHWVFYWPTGKMQAEGDAKAGKRVGTWKGYWEGGEPQIALNYVDDAIADGEVKVLFPNGRLEKTFSFKSGKVDGQVTMFSPMGKAVLNGMFKADDFAGTWVVNYPSGEKKLEADVDQNISDPIGRRGFIVSAFWPDGKPRAKYRCASAILGGVTGKTWDVDDDHCESWFENGTRRPDYECEPRADTKASWCFDETSQPATSPAVWNSLDSISSAMLDLAFKASK